MIGYYFTFCRQLIFPLFPNLTAKIQFYFVSAKNCPESRYGAHPAETATKSPLSYLLGSAIAMGS